MKTKALLLAAVAVAAVASAQAQVYSVNAVGYVNVNIDPGFNMVSNPLQAADNSIQSLFKNFQGTIPGGLKIYNFNQTTGGFDTIQWNDLDNVYDPAADAAKTVTPGNGVFVFNPSQTQLKLTFVGEVPQGPLSNPLPKGFSIKASQVPQEGKPDALGLPGQGGDKIFRYNKTTKAYDGYTFDDLDNQWVSNSTGLPGLPTIPVGEAFFVFRAQSAGAWTRTFSVNNPT
jgi:hypothetical protein